MPTIITSSTTIALRLTPIEKIWALRGDITIYPAAVTTVEVVDDGLAAVRGMRAPGLGVPGLAKIGSWRRRGTTTVAVIRGSGPALRVLLGTGHVREILVSTADPHADRDAIRAVLPVVGA